MGWEQDSTWYPVLPPVLCSCCSSKNLKIFGQTGGKRKKPQWIERILKLISYIPYFLEGKKTSKTNSPRSTAESPIISVNYFWNKLLLIRIKVGDYSAFYSFLICFFFFFFICINVTVLIKQAFIKPLGLPKNLEVCDIVWRALGSVLGLCLFICVKRRGKLNPVLFGDWKQPGSSGRCPCHEQGGEMRWFLMSFQPKPFHDFQLREGSVRLSWCTRVEYKRE